MKQKNDIILLLTSKLDNELLSFYQSFSKKIDKNNVEKSLKLNILNIYLELFNEEEAKRLSNIILNDNCYNNIDHDLAFNIVGDLLFNEHMFSISKVLKKRK